MRARMSTRNYRIAMSLTAVALMTVLTFAGLMFTHMWVSGVPIGFAIVFGVCTAALVTCLVALFPTLRREHYEGY